MLNTRYTDTQLYRRLRAVRCETGNDKSPLALRVNDAIAGCHVWARQGMGDAKDGRDTTESRRLYLIEARALDEALAQYRRTK